MQVVNEEKFQAERRQQSAGTTQQMTASDHRSTGVYGGEEKRLRNRMNSDSDVCTHLAVAIGFLTSNVCKQVRFKYWPALRMYLDGPGATLPTCHALLLVELLH